MRGIVRHRHLHCDDDDDDINYPRAAIGGQDFDVAAASITGAERPWLAISPGRLYYSEDLTATASLVRRKW